MQHAETVSKLKSARDLISQKGAWIQGTFARDKNGFDCEGIDPTAVCFCAMGAIDRAVGETNSFFNFAWPLYRALDNAGFHNGISEWNDAPERTQEEVVALFDKAIEIAETA